MTDENRELFKKTRPVTPLFYFKIGGMDKKANYIKSAPDNFFYLYNCSHFHVKLDKIKNQRLPEQLMDE